MTKLYTELAKVYHEMYQNIFDYEKEFQFYDKISKKRGNQFVSSMISLYLDLLQKMKYTKMLY